jgi:hypothetical protein
MEKIPKDYNQINFDEVTNKFWDDYKYGWSIQKLRPWIEVLDTTWWTKKYCFGAISINQAINTSATTTLSLNTYTTNDSWMSATNNRITITKTWLYHIIWAVTLSYSSSWVREIILRVNWTINTDLHFQATQSSWDYTSCIVDRYLLLTAWNYLELRLYQTSWVSLDAIANTTRTFFQAVEI